MNGMMIYIRTVIDDRLYLLLKNDCPSFFLVIFVTFVWIKDLPNAVGSDPFAKAVMSSGT